MERSRQKKDSAFIGSISGRRPIDNADLKYKGNYAKVFSISTFTSSRMTVFDGQFETKISFLTIRYHNKVLVCVLVYRYTKTLMNCVTTPCIDMKTIGIPPCTGTPGQPQVLY